MKKLLFLVLFLFSIVFTPHAFAQGNSFVSIVNPIRGNDFWDLKGQTPETAVSGQIAILNKASLSATWLIRFDALDDKNIINQLQKRDGDETGLFLEVTSSWTEAAGVGYRKSDIWHAAGSAFLSGYERADREKLIDAAFEKFKSIFGNYPVSVGAWWIDSYSLGYMEKKYGLVAALIVADQYSTDNYQIWGQYFGTPYYPSSNNALHPAQSLENKSDIVIMQWATRDPVNGYGNGVTESTFSLQANDYLDYHDLDINYFARLIDIYTKQQFNQLAHVVVGLENSYDWNKYSGEYEKQAAVLKGRTDSGQLSVVPMKGFANWYKTAFPKLSPAQLLVADDPLGTNKKTVWFMDPYYRAAIFINQEGVTFRDIRQYIGGEEELCYLKSCLSVNFATFATRVLDDVTYGSKWVIDEGRIKDFQVSKQTEGYLITYANAAGNKRQIEFLPRDIKVDDQMFTIDGAILNAIKQDQSTPQKIPEFSNGPFNWSIFSITIKLASFILFLIFATFLPGLIFTNKLFGKNTPFFQKVFLSGVVGFVLLTVIFYVSGLLNLRFLPIAYIAASLLLFFRLKIWTKLKLNLHVDKLTLISLLVILLGTIFQSIPTFRSGLVFPYGLGFWGPNTHDGVWHVALINQLIAAVPPQNPVYSGEILKNYHFFYDLLVAATVVFTKIPVADLTFRFYPVLFSILLGIGTYYLVVGLFAGTGAHKAKIAAILSIYLVYFAGSFGWIVEYIKQKTLGGESAFWANQSVSFNLNPPFAVSLLIIIAFLHALLLLNKGSNIAKIAIPVLLVGSLAGFKVYGAVLVIIALIPPALIHVFKREYSLLYITFFSALFASVIFLSNFRPGQQLLTFAPFWFIHSMMDSPSRIGWDRLTLARVAGLETQNYFKFISAEIIGLVLFIAGNLGIRIVSIVSLFKIKGIASDSRFLFILFFSIISFVIPVIFTQSGTPWNTIQFSYYGLYAAAVISGAVLSNLFFSFPRVLAVGILFVLLVLAPINSITTASYYLGSPHAVVSNQENEALKFLSNQSNGVVLTYPYDDKLKNRLAEPRPLLAYDSTAYVAALSQKPVFLEDEPQNQILLTEYKKRIVASKDFFIKPISVSRKFLLDNNIKYVYLPKIHNVQLDESAGIVKNIFENKEVVIYEVK